MRKRLSLVVAAGLAVLSLTGCSNLFSTLFGKTSSSSTALSVQVVTEYKNNLTGSTAKALSRAITTTLTASQIDALVSAAQAAVDTAGLHDSTAVDKIVATMVQGVAAQVQIAAASATPIDLSSALVVAAQSAVTSIAKTGRESNVSSGLTTETAIAQVTAAMVKVTDSTIVDPQVRAATKAAMVTEAVAALDTAETVTTAAQASAAVTSIVQQVAATQTSDAASFQAVLAAAATSSASLTKVDSATKATMAADVATAAVTAISDAKAAGSVVANEDDLVTAVAAEVGDIDPTAATSVAAAIQTAVTANTSLAVSTTVQGNISTIVSETAPTVTATAQISGGIASNTVSVSTSGTVVTLLATPSSGASVVGWTRLSPGPEPVNTTNAWTVTVLTSGTFVYQVTIKNDAGVKTAQETVTIISTVGQSSATDYINQGIQYLGSQNLEMAKYAFTSALAADPTSKDALFWKTFVDLMGVAVNPDFVSVMRDRFGFSGYPNTLSVLMSNTWMSQMWYGTKGGFEPVTYSSSLNNGYVRGDISPATSGSNIYFYTDANPDLPQSQVGSFAVSATGSAYVDAYQNSTLGNGLYYSIDNNTQVAVDSTTPFYLRSSILSDLTRPYLLPAITAPSWAPKLGERSSTAYYALTILANVIDRNPTGLSAILDSLVGATGPFGSGFDSLVANVKSLAASDSVTIPPNLITALTGTTPAFAVKVTGAELLAFAAELELDKGLLQYIDSYDFTYPLSFLRWDFGDTAAMSSRTNGVPDVVASIMTAVPGPFKQTATTKLLADRNPVNGMRVASRQTIANAASDLSTAATLIQGNLAAGAYDSYIPSSVWSGAYASLADYDTAMANQAGSYIPYIASFHDSVADTTGTKALSVTFGTSTIDVYVGVIFDSPVFSLPNLFIYDASNVSPVLYAGTAIFDMSGNGVQEPSDFAPLASAPTGFNEIALRFNVSKITTVWPGFTSYWYKNNDGNYYSSVAREMTAFSSTTSQTGYLAFMKWFLGQ